MGNLKISTKGRYALRLMIDLAIKDIAKRQEISEKYLEQIISILNRAGYIKSVRGPQGGHRLARHPREYTAGMILRLTEGSLSPVACLDDDINQCSRQAQCATLELWKMLDKAIINVVDNVTLEDLVQWQINKNNNYII